MNSPETMDSPEDSMFFQEHEKPQILERIGEAMKELEELKKNIESDVFSKLKTRKASVVIESMREDLKLVSSETTS